MTTRQITVQRWSVISPRSFEDVVAAFGAAIGHPNVSAFQSEIGAAKTYAEMEGMIQRALGKSGFMEFARFDLGAVLRKESGQGTPKILRLVIGNPLVMKEMAKHVPDAGSYAPVTVLIDERPDGVHLSYDTMASFLAPYGSDEALRVARDLDAKVESLIREAAGVTYSITKIQLSPQPVLVTRRQVKPADIARALGEMFQRVHRYAQRNGIALTGPPVARYLECKPDLWNIEAGMPVAAMNPAPDGDDVVTDVLPGGLAATTTHTGPYDKLPQAHATIQRWAEAESLKIGGAVWESYVTDPADYPNPNDWKTEVFWPLSS